MNKPLILIDDAISRLEERQADILSLDMEASVSIKSSLDFCSFTGEGDIVFREGFNKQDIRVLFIHTSYDEPKFPENKVSVLRDAMKPCPVVGFSGQTRTDLSIPKINYSNFKDNFIDFLTIYKEYDEIMLSLFTSPTTRYSDLAKQYFYELDNCINAGEQANVLINSCQFLNLLKLSGETSLNIEMNLDSDSFLRLCRTLVKTIQ